jgi:hypothetical protein
MKKFLYLLTLAILISLIDGCEPDNTDGPDTDVRDKYLGTWIFTEGSANRSVKATYSVVISKDPSNSSQVLLANFGDSGGAAALGIATSSRITVPAQSIASDWAVEGSGSLSNSSTMSWTYSITAGGDKTDYIATATLQ